MDESGENSFSELNDISEFGYECIIEEGKATLKETDGENAYDYIPLDDWVQIGQLLISAEDLSVYIEPVILAEFLLKLHHRCLGCRIAFDDEYNLAVVNEIMPHEKKAEIIAMKMDQM